MSENSAQGSVNFPDLTLSLKNGLDHLIPTDNQSDEDTDDFFSVRRYSIQAGDIYLVKQNNGSGKTNDVCVFVTKCYVVNDGDDEKEARVEFSNNTVLQMFDSVMIFCIDAHGVVQNVLDQH